MAGQDGERLRGEMDFLGRLRTDSWIVVFRAGVESPFRANHAQAAISSDLLVLWAVLDSLPRYRVPMAGPAPICVFRASNYASSFWFFPTPFSLPCLAATTGFPLLDARLAQLDAMIGFHWDAAARWVA